MTILFIPSLSFAGSIWVSENNFTDKPNYTEVSELKSSDISASCELNINCDATKINGVMYYKAVRVTEENHINLLLGKWTGGNCSDDYWLIKTGMQFHSQYPNAEGIYAWSGSFSFENEIYSEQGGNSRSGNPENSSAELFYVSSKDQLIHKSIPENEDLERKDHFYFERCK